METKSWVVQTTFVGSHGRIAQQFFAGISTGSGAPLWVNCLKDAVHFPNIARAQEWMYRCRFNGGRATHHYSVAPSHLAIETGTMTPRAGELIPFNQTGITTREG